MHYEIPMIVYIDINTEITESTYKNWKKDSIAQGWKIHEMNEWTRKGAGSSQKNTNIDIVITRDIEEDDLRIKLLEYKEIISDHRPI